MAKNPHAVVVAVMQQTVTMTITVDYLSMYAIVCMSVTYLWYGMALYGMVRYGMYVM